MTGPPSIATLLLMRESNVHTNTCKMELRYILKIVKQTGKSREPCFTRELDLLNEEKGRRYRRYKRIWDPANLQLFCDARTKALDAIKSAKQLYYYERLKTIHDSKHSWNELRNLGLCSNGLDAPRFFLLNS